MAGVFHADLAVERPDRPRSGTVEFVYGGAIFLRGGCDELRARTLGMMLLISLAILVVFADRAVTTMELFNLYFWWELALVVTILLLRHWQERKSIGQA